MIARFALILSIVLGCSHINISIAQEASYSLDVEAGLYLNDIHEINLKENYFIVDLWLWLRWDDDAAKVLMGDSGYAPFDSLEIVSGVVLQRMNEFVEARNSGVYASARWLVKIKHTFDVASFPLDSHFLSIRLEDSFYNSSELQFHPDSANTAISARINMPLWRITDKVLSARNFHYETNFGDPNASDKSAYYYSRLALTWKIYKSRTQALIKTFWVTFLAVIVGILSLLVRPDDLDARFGLQVGAIFAIAANSINVSRQLPDVQQFVLADVIQITSVVFLMVCISRSILALKLLRTGISYGSTVRRMDSIFFWGLSAAYPLVITTLYLSNK